MKAIYGRLAAVVVLLFGLAQAASAATVSVEVPDVTGAAGASVDVGLFVDGLRVEIGPSLSAGFDLQAELLFDPSLTLSGIAASSSPPASEAFVLISNATSSSSPSTVSFNSIYTGNEGDTVDFLNAEMLLLTFDIGATGGSFPIAVSSFDYAGATVVPLPAAAWLLGGGLFALSFYRRRR